MSQDATVNSQLLERIRDLSSGLPEQQKKVAIYILCHYKEASFSTATTIAMKLGVGATTINRFSQQIGYAGWADLQADLQALVQSELTALDRIDLQDAPSEAFKKVLNAEIDSLNRNIRLISKQHYLDALDLIASKKKLLIVGHQASEAPAVYASYCLSKVRTNVHRFDLSNSDVLGMINRLSSEDVALVFAHPRYPIKTVQAIDIFNKYSVPIILVTHSENSPYVNKAHVVLGISIRYHQFTDGLSPLICLVNALALDLYWRNEAEGKKNLETFESVTPYLFV